MAGIGEVPDVVEREAVDRLAAVPAHAAGVRGDRHLQIETRAPERIVVVGALEAERVDEHAPVGQGIGHEAGRRRDRAPHVIGDHHHLEPELADSVGRLLDRLLGCVHRHHRRRRHPVLERGEHLRVHAVHRAGHRAPQFLVGIRHVKEPERGVDQGEVDAEVVEALVEEARDHRGGPVERAGGLPPPRRPHEAPVEPVGRRGVVPGGVGRLLHELLDRARHLRPGHVAEIVEEDRDRLQPVPVPVDHRVSELRPHLRRLRVPRIGHHVSPWGGGLTLPLPPRGERKLR